MVYLHLILFCNLHNTTEPDEIYTKICGRLSIHIAQLDLLFEAELGYGITSSYRYLRKKELLELTTDVISLILI